MDRNLTIGIDEYEKIAALGRALGSDIRVKIIKLLNNQSYNVNEIAEKLGIPLSTAAVNIRILEDNGLIITDYQPGIRGSMKICCLAINSIQLHLYGGPGESKMENVTINMPIGYFTDYSVVPTCGLVSDTGQIDTEDTPQAFFTPERVNAQLIWFHKGYLEYKFPNSAIVNKDIKNIELSMELCSEAPNFRDDWPSDISLEINGVDVGFFTSPGDFGDRRGALNPSWWLDGRTQYGHLKVWSVDKFGSYIDKKKVSNVNVDMLKLNEGNYITVRLMVKDDAKNVGGINIFGSKFGDYNQDIVLKLYY